MICFKFLFRQVDCPEIEPDAAIVKNSCSRLVYREIEPDVYIIILYDGFRFHLMKYPLSNYTPVVSIIYA